MSNSNELPDIQKTKDPRNVYIQQAGICNLKIPISIKTRDSVYSCNTIANVKVSIDVDPEIKGINMSRLPIFVQYYDSLTLDIMVHYTDEICKICESRRCDLEYNFSYFLKKVAPISKQYGVVSYDCSFKVIKNGYLYNKFISVTAIASTCCPCSKEISDYNAHNQKCYITLSVKMNNDGFIWLEDLIKIAEDSASCEIFSVLKRPDEKYVTEKMYDHPQFVEDVVRDAYLKLKELPIISEFKVTAEADESIHMHKACASIQTDGWVNF